MFDRLDAVQIKITLPAAQADTAVKALAPPPDGVPRRIYFCEDIAEARLTGELRLLDSGIILRLRETSIGDEDSTVKLRPCRRSRLASRWVEFHRYGEDEFRIEADWAGERRALAASMVSNRGQGEVHSVLAGRHPLRHVFSNVQREFLAECADVSVDLDTLEVLGPVHARRWRLVNWQGLDLIAERWTMTGIEGEPLDLLELSLRVQPQGAEIAQLGLETVVHRSGLDPDPNQETKTRRVIERFARATRRSADTA